MFLYLFISFPLFLNNRINVLHKSEIYDTNAWFIYLTFDLMIKISDCYFQSSKRSFSIMPSKSGEHDLPQVSTTIIGYIYRNNENNSRNLCDNFQAKLFPPRHDTMLPKGSYDNRTVLITGGGTGLGKGMALKFSELGANVAIAAR